MGGDKTDLGFDRVATRAQTEGAERGKARPAERKTRLSLQKENLMNENI